MKFILFSVLFYVLSFNSKVVYCSKCADKIDPSNMTMPCDQIFNIFHKCTGQFLEKTLATANPFTLCTNYEAHDYYRKLTLWLNLLQNTQDPKNFNVTCSDEYLNKNQMAVISRIVSTSKGIWESANCDDCYEGTPQLKQNFSANTIQFKKDYYEYSDCVSKYRTNYTAVCTKCFDYYITLNNLFDHYKNRNNGKICFDLEDIMNKTRQEWSVEFRCCKDKRDSLKAFYSLFATIIILTIIFYVSIYITGSTYAEQETLDASEISNNINAVRPSTSSGSSTNSSNSEPNPKDEMKRKLVINDDDDDDDDVSNILGSSLPPQNNQLLTLDN